MNDFARITTYNTRAEAELAVGLLKGNNIKSFTSDVSGVPHLHLFNGPTHLLVRKEDAQKALEILKI